LWEKVEEPKRVRWTKQRGDESAAVEKLSKRFTQIFRAPQTEEQAEKSLLFCKTKEQDRKALLRHAIGLQMIHLHPLEYHSVSLLHSIR